MAQTNLFSEGCSDVKKTVVDSEFQLKNSGQLRLLISGADAGSLSDFLSAEILRNPKNIQNHIRRIWLQFDQECSVGLAAALYDLSIALEGSGKALYRRMLLGSQSALDKPMFTDLVDKFNGGGISGKERMVFPGSLLDCGVRGSLNLVSRFADGVASGQSDEQDPLEEARDCLEYSQIEQARDILERAVINDPERSELQSDLLIIYRSSHDLNGLNAMKEKMESNGIPVDESWCAVAEEISRVKEV